MANQGYKRNDKIQDDFDSALSDTIQDDQNGLTKELIIAHQQEHIFANKASFKDILTKESFSQYHTKDKEYKQYPYRFLIVLLYLIPNVANAAGWITFSPIAVTVQKAYNEDAYTVNLAALSYMFVFIVVNFPSNYVLDDYGIRTGITIGTLFTITGLWVRILINDSFVWVIIGQILGGIGQPFILNAPAKIAAFWFIPEHRPLATAILSLINPVGVGVGFIIPGMVVDDFDVDNDQEHSKQQVQQLLFYLAIVFTVLCIPTLIFFKNKPPTPPSSSAESDRDIFRNSLKILFKDKNFIIMTLGFGFIFGNFNTAGTLINQFFQPFGFDDTFASICGAIFIVSGLIGGLFAGLYVEKTLHYKKTLVVLSFSSLISLGLFIYLMTFKNKYYTSFTMFAFGFTTTPILPITLDFGCEIVYPIGEALTTGVLVTAGQIVTIISQFLALESQMNVIYANLIGFGLALFGVFINVFIKENLKRANDEREKGGLDKLPNDGDEQHLYFQQIKEN